MAPSLSTPAFSAEEKSSLTQVLARFGRGSVKKHGELPGRPLPKASSALTFTAVQARALVVELLERVGLRFKEDDHSYLLQILTALPYMPGSAVDVFSANADELLKLIPEHFSDKTQQHLADRALRLLAMAVTLKDDPSLQPWCDIAAVAAERERLAFGSSKELTDSEKESLRFLAKVEDSGLLRRPCPVPDPHALLELIERFPNFEAPVRFLAEQAALAKLRGDQRFCPIPILLSGPAGVGKTHFAMALAEVYRTHTETINMASQTCGFTLSGMDPGWSSARCGMVFSALLHGANLSPVVVLDEIDKANSDAKSDPLGPLYSLLETRTARAFRDEYAGFAIDASQFIWIATANDITCIPAPVLSRFVVFDIQEPTPEQMAVIAERLFAEIAAGLPGAPERMPRDWHSQCAGQSVRALRLLLQRALGKAALRASTEGQHAISVRKADLQSPYSNERKRIGF